MDCTVGDIARIMEQWAPRELAEPGDNVGLLAGISTRPSRSVLITLDVTEEVIRHSADIGADMIIAHHPFLYRPIAAVTDSTEAGRLAVLAIERGIAVYAAHTNLDRAEGGVNDALCDALGLVDVAPAGQGSIARISRYPLAVALDTFAAHARQALDAPLARVTGRGESPIQYIYVISGAGRHDIAAAARSGVDCMLTGEIGYHDGQDALAADLSVVELGHYHTERVILKRIEKHLQSQFHSLQYTVRTSVFEKSTCPFRYVF